MRVSGEGFASDIEHSEIFFLGVVSFDGHNL